MISLESGEISTFLLARQNKIVTFMLFSPEKICILKIKSLPLHRGFFIIVLDLRLTKMVRGCRETSFNFLYQPHFFPGDSPLFCCENVFLQ